MFTWICPKCGSEVPPSFSECPECISRSASQPEKPVPVPTTEVAVEPATPAAAPPVASIATPSVLPKERRQLPSAAIVVLTMASIAALLWLIYFVVIPKKSVPMDSETTGRTASAGTSTNEQDALAKHLEISGIRLLSEGNRAKIQFLIVNHSAAELPELRLQVQLSAGGKAIFEFPFTVPSMGPYESRDLSTTVRTSLKPYEWPDWQLLRPQFRVLP